MKKELYIAKLALISLYFSDKSNSMAVPKLRLKTSLIIRLPLSNRDIFKSNKSTWSDDFENVSSNRKIFKDFLKRICST